MRAFEYVPAKTVAEATSLLAEKGDQAKPLAGGTDLIVMVRENRRQLERMVDIKDLPETNVLSYSPDTGLDLGAAVSLSYDLRGRYHLRRISWTD